MIKNKIFVEDYKIESKMEIKSCMIAVVSTGAIENECRNDRGFISNISIPYTHSMLLPSIRDVKPQPYPPTNSPSRFSINAKTMNAL